MPKRVPSLRVPDEIRYLLNSVASRFPTIAEFDENDEVRLKNLTKAEKVALSFVSLHAELEGTFKNLDLVLGDFERLRDDPHAFGDAVPIDRFKVLMRLCFYEYGRFEDLFGFYTLWLERNKLLKKEQRREMRQFFYETHEPIIRGRNALLHDAPNWKKWHTSEIALLESADLLQSRFVKRDTGKALEWSDELAPKCEEVIALWSKLARDMATTWSMLYAQAVALFIEAGTMRRAKRPFGVTKMDVVRLQRDGILRPSRAMETAELLRQMELLNKRLKELMQLPAIQTLATTDSKVNDSPKPPTNPERGNDTQSS